MTRPSCIYCRRAEATDRDHVPPLCLFPVRPQDAITVPSCRGCNEAHGRDDESARNLVTSLASTETHPAVRSVLSSKRDRALARDLAERGGRHVQHLLDSIIPVCVQSAAGLYVGTGYAFQLDQPVLDRFLSRLTRALLWHENSVSTDGCEIEWRMAPSWAEVGEMAPELRTLLLSPGTEGSVGGDVFRYLGYVRRGSPASLWFFRFYDGVEFMTRCRRCPDGPT